MHRQKITFNTRISAKRRQLGVALLVKGGYKRLIVIPQLPKGDTHMAYTADQIESLYLEWRDDRHSCSAELFSDYIGLDDPDYTATLIAAGRALHNLRTAATATASTSETEAKPLELPKLPRKVKTIDTTPTWQEFALLLCNLLEHGDETGRVMACKEVTRLAAAVDHYASLGLCGEE